ncbi:ABC transporter ATP-binding protein [Alteromonas sp. C1M14]|uniref:ABC transporter ATP-binding protein n=1 Tax=Alteromonas sp. C1M14 TaxID=2841567 RepID=UPI001C092533|nr:ABC transporter ATP-binding protein [Alteromonas sp. C1M14]MBU2978152.1 ABC transporter ATP-binding protein [Alteromonas sp. C1M14]
MLNVHIKHKAYQGNHTLIRDFSLSVKANEIVALIGPSGAGKSTLLNIICGLDSQFDGDITYQQPSNVSMMFQEARLMPWLTVLENITLVAKKQSEDVTRYAYQLLEQVGLSEVANGYPGQLSGGMSKRVALARAMMFNPDILLMDEPFSSLDTPSAEALKQRVLELKNKRPFSIIYVTHDLKEAIAIADRVLVLCANPMQLVHEQIVNLPRPRHLHDDAIAALCHQLYQRYPGLLSGNVNDDIFV